ncbi:MAG: hypothetical protein ACOZAA_07750 [Pseudomonadota bacterium]
MTRNYRMSLTAAAAILALGAAAAGAQETAAEAPAKVEAPIGVEVTVETPAMNEDEMADFLNSQQQIKQDVTLTRTVDGKVVETTTETITYSADDPLRASEAAQSPIERLKAEFDSKTLTRNEANEEAKLDFVVADLDRNEALTVDEFTFLVEGWQDATVSGAGRSRFVDPVVHDDPAAAAAEHSAQARNKFVLMAEGEASLSRKKYLRRVMADFDACDTDDDEILNGDELLKFRAGNRGETAGLQPSEQP